MYVHLDVLQKIHSKKIQMANSNTDEIWYSHHYINGTVLGPNFYNLDNCGYLSVWVYGTASKQKITLLVSTERLYRCNISGERTELQKGI